MALLSSSSKTVFLISYLHFFSTFVLYYSVSAGIREVHGINKSEICELLLNCSNLSYELATTPKLKWSLVKNWNKKLWVLNKEFLDKKYCAEMFLILKKSYVKIFDGTVPLLCGLM